LFEFSTGKFLRGVFFVVKSYAKGTQNPINSTYNYFMKQVLKTHQKARVSVQNIFTSAHFVHFCGPF